MESDELVAVIVRFVLDVPYFTRESAGSLVIQVMTAEFDLISPARIFEMIGAVVSGRGGGAEVVNVATFDNAETLLASSFVFNAA